jgi:hypothetical protein
LEQFPAQIKHDTGQSLAVGAVLDQATANLNPDEDLDVVVAVGINYGQFAGSRPSAIPNPKNWAATGMWRRLLLVLQRLDEECLVGQVEERYEGIFSDLDNVNKPFHLVAVNYFPWLTTSEWGEIGLNSISESLAVRCWGYEDPAKHIANLIKSIAKQSKGTQRNVGEFPFILFHGASNAVSYLALDTIRCLKDNCFANYIFCDNLSRPFPPVNAVVLVPWFPVSLARGPIREVADD